MKKAPIPENEEERLAELLAYQILDTEPESAYDDITFVASQICETPIALVSLVDEKRQWFKSRRGLVVTETPRDISFCGHAIHEIDLFEVEDSSMDERFADNPLATGEAKVVFYAGYPLQSRTGAALGTLCVMDHQPRRLTSDQRQALSALARQVSSQLELRRANMELHSAFERIRDQARDIQNHQMKLMNSAKMASLGQMAGGIAHEINNPLAVIEGRIAQIKRSVANESISPNELDEKLSSIQKQVKRITNIVKSMLEFSHQGDSSRTVIQLSEVVDKVFLVFSEKCRLAEVELKRDVDSHLKLMTNPTHFYQVMINLLNNAFDAVQTSNRKTIRVSAREAEACVEISVEDSGPGISPELAEKIMEPFFTTKPVGVGTGLGLSISSRLIQASGGELSVDTERKKGARFIIRCPIDKLPN